MQYLKIDGRGDPNTSPAFAEVIGALYPVGYKLKFASKRALGRDYVVPPLEGLWWADDMDAFTTARDKSLTSATSDGSRPTSSAPSFDNRSDLPQDRASDLRTLTTPDMAFGVLDVDQPC